MASFTSDLAALAPCFSFLDATPEGFPGHFQFCIPNDAAYRRWPAYPSAASPERGRAAAGRGLDEDACRVSGLGEAVELASVCSWGDERVIRASQNELGRAAIPANAILGLAPDQLDHRDSWNRGAFAALDWRPRPQDPATPVDWIETGEGSYVSADIVLVGRREKGDEEAVAVATTSGCAAGESLRDARQRALREVLERDAIGRWWYGGQAAASLPSDLLAAQGKLAAFLSRRPRRTVLLDISSDLCRFVVASASWEPDGGAVALGFAARPTLGDAARDAAVEMLQTEIGLSQRQAAGDALTDLWLRKITADARVFRDLRDMPTPASPLDSLRALSAAGLKPLYLNLTRPEFRVPVVRAVVPGLASDKPRFGSGRCDGSDARSAPLLV